MDQIRIIRIYEFSGDRAAVERQVAMSVQGEKSWEWRGERVTIKAATLGVYPEILESALEKEIDIDKA